MSTPASRLDSRSLLAPRTQQLGSARLRVGRWLRALVPLPASLLLGFIRVYQRALSRALPVITAGACGCRFFPTCSHYAAEAIRTHGAMAGTWLALRRLVKCTPRHPGGLDLVPPAPTRQPTAALKPWCRRTA